MNFLESVIVSLVESEIEEATARVGPRTGAFEFHPQDLKNMMILGVEARDRIGKMIASKTWSPYAGIETTARILSPIDDSKKVFSLVFVWNDEDSPGQVVMEKNFEITSMVINLKAIANPRELHNTIVHELTHVFDKQLRLYSSKIPVDKMTPEERDKHYWTSPMEIKAFLHQMIDAAKHIIADIFSLLPSEVAKDYLKRLEKNPLILKKLMADGWSAEPNYGLYGIEFYMEKFENNTRFQKAFNKALFDLVQAYVVPKLREIENGS